MSYQSVPMDPLSNKVCANASFNNKLAATSKDDQMLLSAIWNAFVDSMGVAIMSFLSMYGAANHPNDLLIQAFYTGLGVFIVYSAWPTMRFNPLFNLGNIVNNKMRYRNHAPTLLWSVTEWLGTTCSEFIVAVAAAKVVGFLNHSDSMVGQLVTNPKWNRNQIFYFSIPFPFFYRLCYNTLRQRSNNPSHQMMNDKGTFKRWSDQDEATAKRSLPMLLAFISMANILVWGKHIGENLNLMRVLGSGIVANEHYLFGPVVGAIVLGDSLANAYDIMIYCRNKNNLLAN